jgi:carboxypeptidase Taq
MTSFEDLLQELRLIAKYGSAIAVLDWDQEVNLPKKAASYRGEVTTLLSTDLHRRLTADALFGLVNKLSAEELNADQRVIVRETKRDLELSRKLPVEFVEAMSLLTTKAFAVWVEARTKKDFKLFEPVLTEMVEMKKREAEYLGYKASPYDALLDEYEPGMTVEKVDAIFGPLAESLAGLIKEAPAKPAALATASYSKAQQEKLNEEIAKRLGYDMDAGRIDVSPHPFTTSFHPTDVRVTTRYDEKDFWVSLGSVIHEVGHGLYEQGLPANHWSDPLGEAVSLGVHESQSRSWENFVGRSREFVAYLYPLLKKYFGEEVKYGEDELYAWLNRVSPNLIRVESDEVTYNMHIVLRYELEKALIEGTIAASDLPAAWNEKVKKYLNLDVPSDDLGVLQDVHWSHGSIGYFPTYTLGNVYAAQLFKTAEQQIPAMKAEFAKGNFKPYLDWLRQNIHSQGRRYQPDELITKVTGEAPNSAYLLEHLKSKLELTN